MNRRFLGLVKTSSCFLMFVACLAPLQAADLMEVYEQALQNDPTFKAAYSTFMSNSEALPQAQAALLPQLGSTAQASFNYIEAEAGLLSVQGTYRSDNWGLTASQAVFNYQVWAQLKQAKASVKAAHATFNSAAQELILRTAKAYFDVLFAKDTLKFAEIKLKANKRQLEQARQRFEVGLDAITSVYEAKAAYDQSIAEVISAKNNEVNQSENLRKLTNHVYDRLSPLRNSTIPLIKPEPNDVNAWIDRGLKQNYQLLSSKYSLQVARENIKAQTAGNWPTLSIQGSSSTTHNNVPEQNVFAPMRQQSASIALAVNFPFYQGGLVQSKTRQAQYDFQTNSEKLEETYRDIVVNSQIAFNTIIDGISKVKADRQTIISQQNSLESTEAQFQVGTRTMVDVVNAQRRLFEAQEQLASDQYNFIKSILKLKFLAGTLNVTDLEEINAWLATTRISSFPPQENPLPKHGQRATGKMNQIRNQYVDQSSFRSNEPARKPGSS